MDVGTYIRRVQSGFGDYNGIVIDDTEIIDWLNEAMDFVVRETQCIKTSLSTPANTFPIIIDDMFLLDAAYYGDRLINFTSDDNITSYNPVPMVGTPAVYYLNGVSIYLYPTPAVGDTTSVRVSYVPEPTHYTDATPANTVIDLPIPYHNDLVIFALARAHEKNENYRAAELKMQEFNGNVAYRRYEMQMGKDSPYQMVPDPYDVVDDNYYGSLL